MSGKNSSYTTKKLCFIGVMSAIIFVTTMLKIPVLGSKVHLGGPMCLLSGLLLGPSIGGLAAAIGSALNDVLYGGYDVIEALVTFASRFIMAWVCGKLAASDKKAPSMKKAVPAAVGGAAAYVIAYMLKTFIKNKFVLGFEMTAVWATMISKLPASLINAVVGAIVAPILFTAVSPAMSKIGLYKIVRPNAGAKKDN